MTDCRIGKKLRLARLQAELTQNDAGSALNYSRSTIGKKETGDRPIYAHELAEFARVYEQDISYFFED